MPLTQRNKYEWIAFSGTAIIFMMLSGVLLMRSGVSHPAGGIDESLLITSSLDLDSSDDEGEVHELSQKSVSPALVLPPPPKTAYVLKVTREIVKGNGLTVSTWIKFLHTPEREWCLLSWLGKGDNYGDKRWLMTLGPDRRVRMSVYSRENVMIQSRSNRRLKPGEWVHIAASYHTVGGARLIINGVMDSSMPSGLPRDLPPFYRLRDGIGDGLLSRLILVGKCSFQAFQPAVAADNDFRGQIAQIRVSGKSWSAKQVRKRMFVAPMSPVYEFGLDEKLISACGRVDMHQIREIYSNLNEVRWSSSSSFPKGEVYARVKPLLRQEVLRDGDSHFSPLSASSSTSGRSLLTVVRPFHKTQVSDLIWSLNQFKTQTGRPCDDSTFDSAVDMFLLYAGKFNAELEDLLASSSALEDQKCFRKIHIMPVQHSEFGSAVDVDIDIDIDIDAEHTLTESVYCESFYRVMEMPSIAQKYKFMLYMPSDVVPFRPRWLERAVIEAMLSSFESFWVKGGIQHFHYESIIVPKLPQSESDPSSIKTDPTYFQYPTYLEPTWSFSMASMYALGDERFNKLLSDVYHFYVMEESNGHPGGCWCGFGRNSPLLSSPSGGFPYAIFEYRSREMQFRHSQRDQHMFKTSELTIDVGSSPFRPWVLLKDYPHAYLVKSKWALYKDVWNEETHHSYMKPQSVHREYGAHVDWVEDLWHRTPSDDLKYRY